MSDDNRRQLVSAKFSIPHFLSSFEHCGQVSKYLARLVSTGRADADSFYGLFSDVLSRVLESAYHHNGGDGDMNLKLSGSKDDITIDLQIPVDAAARAFYEGAVRSSPEPGRGIFGLSAAHATTIDMAETKDPAKLALCVRLSLTNAAAKDLSS